MRFLIVWFALLAAACGDRQAASRDTTRHSVAALRPVTTDTSPKDVEEVDLGTP